MKWRYRKRNKHIKLNDKTEQHKNKWTYVSHRKDAGTQNCSDLGLENDTNLGDHWRGGKDEDGQGLPNPGRMVVMISTEIERK